MKQETTKISSLYELQLYLKGAEWPRQVINIPKYQLSLYKNVQKAFFTYIVELYMAK